MNETGSTAFFFEQLNTGNVLRALLVLAVTWVVVRLMSGFTVRLGQRFSDRRLLLNQVSATLRFAVWTIGVVIAVLTLNLTKEFMLALTGAAAVTVGFALKDLAASVIAGVIIIVDRPFQVGDRVSFGGYYGEIREIGLRSVRLSTLDDTLVTIPNNKFLTEVTASANAGALDMMVQMDFFVGVDQNLPMAKRLLEQCVVSNPYVYTGKSWTVLVNQVIEGNYFAYRLRAKAYVLDVKYEKAYETELTERVHESFNRHGIGAPAVLARTAAEAAAAS